LLNELEQAHQIIRQCMHEMNDEQILEVAKLNQNNNLSRSGHFVHINVTR
jgi:NADH:ubiquinone oxidoreductase subunit D